MKNRPMPPPMIEAPVITVHEPLLQALVVTADGVEYMFFGPPIATDQDSVPHVQALAFAGYMPVSQMVELLKNAGNHQKSTTGHVQ